MEKLDLYNHLNGNLGQFYEDRNNTTCDKDW